MVSDIVASYVSNNSVRSGDLAEIIGTVHTTLSALAAGQTTQVVEEARAPAVPIKKSITPDFILCLEDGKKFRSLKRHLATAYGMTPDDYRAKWSLPRDYPMVAPSYAAQRSALAKQSGLGIVGAAGRKPAATRGRGRPHKAA
ncbi:MucR family transcriptional regulator [Beijerinckia sp. L45]|uniref:MucR family transcriptional regulator n=1 Tax=Beijerinckia sp. L45 TaxID=1641855 RepID=UPI0034CF5C45